MTTGILTPFGYIMHQEISPSLYPTPKPSWLPSITIHKSLFSSEMELGCFNSGRTPIRNLTLQVLSGRFFMVFATIMILSLMGTTYIFGLYSNEIKSALGYDQTTLNLLSFFKDLGTAVGIHAGLIMEVTHPWVVLAIGAIINFFGYFMVWLAVIHRITPPVWQMCLYICIGANAIGFANTGALVTCVKNFPEIEAS
ncbi:hypothetical protein Ancab_015843 [Ancistrocladus abbreviatus]